MKSLENNQINISLTECPVFCFFFFKTLFGDNTKEHLEHEDPPWQLWLTVERIPAVRGQWDRSSLLSLILHFKLNTEV